MGTDQHIMQVHKAWCSIVSDDTERADLVCATTREGLGVETRDGEAGGSQHFGRRPSSAASMRGTISMSADCSTELRTRACLGEVA